MTHPTFDPEPYRLTDGSLPAYAWPGGYPLYYVCADGGVLCPPCVNDKSNPVHFTEQYDHQWQVTGVDANYEDPCMYCDHCNKRIESAYAEEEAGEPIAHTPGDASA